MSKGFNPKNDALFEFLIYLVNNLEITIGITVSLNGMVLSGTLISAKEYFAKFGKDFVSGFGVTDKSQSSDLENTFIDMGAKVQDDTSGFFHMENVRLFVGSHPVKGSLWRGRISSVNGFVLGELKP